MKGKEEQNFINGKAKEKDTVEKDTKEMGKVKDTKEKEKESATTAVRTDTWRETACNHSRREKQREKANHFMDGATIAISKDTWQETAGVEKEE